MHPIDFMLWNGSSMEPVGEIVFHTDGSYHVNGEYPVNDKTMEEQFGGNKYFLVEFTGLKDKNGRKIYEGDILTMATGDMESPYEIGTLNWDQGSAAYIWNGEGHMAADYIYQKTWDGEVIGNIYENPELLTS